MWAAPLIFYGHHRRCLNNLFERCDMAFIVPMHRNKPNITYYLFEFGVRCCMLSTFYVSSRIVANIRHNWRKILPENYYPYLQTYSSKFCFSMLLYIYSFLSLSFLLTFFWLGCYCAMWLYFRQVNLMGALTFLFFFFIPFFFKVICGLWMVCYLCDGR